MEHAISSGRLKWLSIGGLVLSKLTLVLFTAVFLSSLHISTSESIKRDRKKTQNKNEVVTTSFTMKGTTKMTLTQMTSKLRGGVAPERHHERLLSVSFSWKIISTSNDS
jgi:hypothetical protein